MRHPAGFLRDGTYVLSCVVRRVDGAHLFDIEIARNEFMNHLTPESWLVQQ